MLIQPERLSGVRLDVFPYGLRQINLKVHVSSPLLY